MRYGAVQVHYANDNWSGEKDDEEGRVRAARAAVIRDRIPVLPVDLDGPRVVTIGCWYPLYNTRYIPRTGEHIKTVNGSG